MTNDEKFDAYWLKRQMRIYPNNQDGEWSSQCPPEYDAAKDAWMASRKQTLAEKRTGGG